MNKFNSLRENGAALPFYGEEGRLLYEFSNARPEYDFSARKKKAVRRSPFGWILPVIAGLLIAWFFTSLIYGFVTEGTAQVLVRHLPTLAVTIVACAILFCSFFGLWGRLVKRPGGKGQSDVPIPETAITITEKRLILWLDGYKFAFDKSKCSALVSLKEGALELTFQAADERIFFPLLLPKEDFPLLKKSLDGRVEVLRLTPAQAAARDDRGRRLYGGYTLGNVLVSAFFSLLILAAGIALTVLSATGKIPVPTLVGVFFIGCSGLTLCNTFHHIPFVKMVGLPLVFGLILTVMPLWALAWLELNIIGDPFGFVWLLTHATPQAMGFMFLSMMGIYAISFAITRAVDIVRFGCV